MNKDLIKWVERNWGRRCLEYDKNCPVCKAWKCYDYLTGKEVKP